MAPSEHDNWSSKGLCQLPTEIKLIFRKIKGYIPSGLGASSFPIDRLADKIP